DDADAVDALPHLDDVAHRTVERLDRVAVEVDVVPPRLAEAPELNHRHATSFACVPTGSVTPVVGSQPERSGGERTLVHASDLRSPHLPPHATSVAAQTARVSAAPVPEA